LRHFGDDLAAAVERRGTPALVGLDPRWEQLPASLTTGDAADLSVRATAYVTFCREIIDVVAPLVPAVKPQAAFFEELGPAGMVALGNVITYARDSGLLVVLDGKRNDIGSTAEAYARGYLGRDDQSAWGADALTVSPYLGADSLEPFVNIADERSTVYIVLLKNKKKKRHMLQDQPLAEGTVYRRVANYVEAESQRTAGQRGYGIVGAVVGATYPEQLAELRSAMPQTWLLVPGFGSQGGTAADVAPAFDHRGLGAIVNNSRGIIFAHRRPEYADRFGAARWQDAVAAATKEMIAQLRAETLAGKLTAH